MIDTIAPNRATIDLALLNKVTSRTIFTEIEKLQTLTAAIRSDLLLDALHVLNSSDRIFIQGIGTSGALAAYMALRLVRRGRQACSTDTTGLRLADFLMPMRKGDVLVLTNRVGGHRDVEVSASHASACDAQTIVLTELVEGELSRAGALILIDAIVNGLICMDRSGADTATEKMNALRSEIAGKPMDLNGALVELDQLLGL
jgi:DNA-binding MurR/RpiR family transcriptional regulator